MRINENSESDERVLFYWNRVGMLSNLSLNFIIRKLDVNKIIFRADLDPGIPITKNFIPEIPSNVELNVVSDLKSKQEYDQIVSNANFHIAPRPYEGIGLTLLEFMAKGAFCIALNKPTANEYIENKSNGLLINGEDSQGEKNRMLSQIYSHEHIVDQLNCDINFKEMGIRARVDMINLRKQWDDQLTSRIDFCLEW